MWSSASTEVERRSLWVSRNPPKNKTPGLLFASFAKIYFLNFCTKIRPKKAFPWRVEKWVPKIPSEGLVFGGGSYFGGDFGGGETEGDLWMAKDKSMQSSKTIDSVTFCRWRLWRVPMAETLCSSKPAFSVVACWRRVSVCGEGGIWLGPEYFCHFLVALTLFLVPRAPPPPMKVPTTRGIPTEVTKNGPTPGEKFWPLADFWPTPKV